MNNTVTDSLNIDVIKIKDYPQEQYFYYKQQLLT